MGSSFAAAADMDLVGMAGREWRVLVFVIKGYRSRPDLGMKDCENVT